MCGKVFSVPWLYARVSLYILALKILVYELAQTTVMHLYCASKSEMLKCGRRSFFCPCIVPANLRC
jgi:hypothetical protein